MYSAFNKGLGLLLITSDIRLQRLISILLSRSSFSLPSFLKETTMMWAVPWKGKELRGSQTIASKDLRPLVQKPRRAALNPANDTWVGLEADLPPVENSDETIAPASTWL